MKIEKPVRIRFHEREDIFMGQGLNFTRLVSMSLGNTGKWLKDTTSQAFAWIRG